MTSEEIKNEIVAGKTILGIEFGSTRIKAVLINSKNEVIAQGSFDWENSLVDGVWTYSLDEVNCGLRETYACLKKNVLQKYNAKLTKFFSIGISGMMHGYLAFDKNGNLLVPFRTWRNTMTREASAKLSSLFNYPVPERWSISHLYQAILKNETHISSLAFLTTLSGYVHWKLTGQKVLGIGDASGMFPIDAREKNYNQKMLCQFSDLVSTKNFLWNSESVLPKVLVAGEKAGVLTKEGALLLDKDGELEEGVPFCPPEGDAGTGMVATNSVAKRTGNISAGTSVFAMLVLEKELSKMYPRQIDLVATPSGLPVAMSHANNCTGDYDAWIQVLGKAAEVLGAKFSKAQLYDTLLGEALKGDDDCAGLLPYNYISGESMTALDEGRAIFVRSPNAHFTLANFMRSHLFTALCAMRCGMDILFEKENVQCDALVCHGGFFKTREVGLKIMAAAMHTKTIAMETAGEGGAWGIALLASYMMNGQKRRLEEFLHEDVFTENEVTIIEPNEKDVVGFNIFYERYMNGLPIVKTATECT